MLTKEKKEKIIKDFCQSEKDTGSSEVQIALLTERIKQISEHLQSFPKDKHSRRGLLKLVGNRRTFIGYLKKIDVKRYENIKSKLGIVK